MTTLISQTFIESIQWAFIGYMAVFGLFSLLKGKTRYFGATLLIFVAYWMSKDFASVMTWQPIALSVWPALYLMERRITTPLQLTPIDALHLLPTVVWIMILNVFPNMSVYGFETCVFIQFIGYALAITGNTFHALRFNQLPARSLVQWIHYGVMVLAIVRLTLPFLLSAATLDSLVNGCVLIFIVSMTPFFINPKDGSSIQSVVEDGLNRNEEIDRTLIQVLQNEKAYLNPQLSLPQLAELMKLKSAELTTFLNERTGKNFNEMVNEYRIHEFIRLLEDPKTDQKATLMELAYRAGFNSKATFNRIFKMKTGQTPKEYKRSSQSSISGSN